MIKKFEIKEIGSLPAIPLRGVVPFWNEELVLDVGRFASINAIYASQSDYDNYIAVTAQRDNRVENPKQDDVYPIGAVVRIKSIEKDGDYLKIRCKFVERINVEEFITNMPFATVYYSFRPLEATDDIGYEKAVIGKLESKFTEVAESANDELKSFVKELFGGIYSAIDTVSMIIEFLHLPMEFKQIVFEQDNAFEMLVKVYDFLNDQINKIKIDASIAAKVKESFDEQQKTAYLRKQLEVIKKELGSSGDDEYSDDDEESYMDKLMEADPPEKVYKKLEKEIKKLGTIGSPTEEGLIKNYLDVCFSLPWDEDDIEERTFDETSEILEADHYGLKDVKDRILEFLAVKKLRNDNKGNIMLLVGPPGVGKSSIAKSVARSINRPFERIALGGISDVNELRGFRRTYVASAQGRLISCLINAKSKSPLILLDEIDKLGVSAHGDPSSTLLEVLDPMQNSKFVDSYLDFPFDLSEVFFIATANSLDTIPAPLLDRMEVIELPSYTREEKFQICKRHLIGKQLSECGLKPSQLKISDGAVYKIIDSYVKEAGVRKLERSIAKICRKSAKNIIEGSVDKISITIKNLKDYLGAEKYFEDRLSGKSEVGVVNGMAWTAVGGTLMPLEAAVLNGSGKTIMTGSLGDVMKESMQTAISYVRSISDKLKIEDDFYKTKDFHLHASETATPKDGPSAGVTIVTALVSALTDSPVKRDIAMTGEVSLHGKVMKIGGLKEKSMGAYSAGVKKIFIPYDNICDIEEIDPIVKEKVEIVPVKDVREILNDAFTSSFSI